MAIPGWQRDESPFHRGERAIHERMGVSDRIEAMGRKGFRLFMPEQHRQFYAQLPHLIVGTVDEDGNPWASIVVGEPGFISTPSDRSLHIAALPLFGDPLAKNLAVNSKVGFLGIEMHTRRRNRVNGEVREFNTDGLSIRVEQSFGNCPKYIQARQFELKDFDSTASKPVHRFTDLDSRSEALITSADTFFIATAFLDDEADLTNGVDVSHRGGQSGFVRVQGNMLTIPDFSGNCIFNTFGNLELNPHAGLLFIDFEQGNLLYLTGAANVIWDEDPELALYSGAERLLKFHLKQGILVEGSLPLSWSSSELSPFLSKTGPWVP